MINELYARLPPGGCSLEGRVSSHVLMLKQNHVRDPIAFNLGLRMVVSEIKKESEFENFVVHIVMRKQVYDDTAY